MDADFLGPYDPNVVLNAFDALNRPGPSPAEIAEKHPSLSPFEGYVVDANATIRATLAVALEQLGALGREVTEIRARFDR